MTLTIRRTQLGPRSRASLPPRTYFLRVRSLNEAGESTNSNVVSRPTLAVLSLSSTTVVRTGWLNSRVGTFGSYSGPVKYELVGGTGSTDNFRFRITGNTLRYIGVVTPPAGANLFIRVRATDSLGRATIRNFTLKVSAGNITPPTVTLSSTTLLENAGANALVGTFGIAGMTASQAVNPIVYTLVSGGADNGLFAISNGQLRAKTSLDYETRPNYSIKVRATDATGKYVEQVIGISLLNVVGA